MDASIFHDPEREAREAEFARPDYAFQLRTGTQITPPGAKKSTPVSLAQWRILAAGEETAKGLAELLGGSPDHKFPEKEHDYEVMTETSSLEVVINGSDAVDDKFVQWGTHGLPIHECDGLRSLLKEDKGAPCGCSGTLKERKAKNRAGKAPGPNIVISMRLAGLGYELGVGRWIATSWQFAETIHQIKDELDDVDGEALVRLEIVPEEFTNSDGELVKYKKPVLTVLGSYNDAISEER
ncbi:recombination directionality factor [Streptomyces sp. NPDC001515]